MTQQSEKVKKWRRVCKQRIINAMGGKCSICHYSKCNSSLALHHLNPNEKDFSFGAIRANPKNWNQLVKELRKCVLLCHNCHAEVHEGIASVPLDVPKFDEAYADYKLAMKVAKQIITECPACGKMKSNSLKYCSPKCAAKNRYGIPWHTIDLKTELQSKSIVQLSEEIGCSDSAIHKRLKKLGLK